VKRKPKSLAKRTAHAQLEGALALVGGNNVVAAYDKSVFVRRAGELIARAATNDKRPQKSHKSEGKRADRS
jgi:hypothetical protein